MELFTSKGVPISVEIGSVTTEILYFRRDRKCLGGAQGIQQIGDKQYE